jgi:hypothetical protein
MFHFVRSFAVLRQNVDAAATLELIMSIAGVNSCVLRQDGDRLRAEVSAAADEAALRQILRERQPWWSGTAVPDELVITP